MIGDNEHDSPSSTPPGKRRHLTPALKSSGLLFQPGFGLSRYSDIHAMNSDRQGPMQLPPDGPRIHHMSNEAPASVPVFPAVQPQRARAIPAQASPDVDGPVGYAERVMQAPPRSRSNKRSRSSSSPSKISTTVAPSELRAKRQFLERLVPSCTFGPPALAEDPHDDTNDEDDTFGNYNPDPMPLSPPVALPPHVLDVIRTLSPATFEVGCIPLVPGTTTFLETFVPYEVFPAHTFLAVPSPNDHPRALALLHFAIGVHRTCTHNCANALDEAAWYPCVQTLLSVTPGRIPYPPPSQLTPPSPTTLFLTVDATTKLTSSTILPSHPNVKLDALVVFNHAHKSVAATLARSSARVNALADACADRAIVAVGVEVKPTGGGGGLLAAEYQLGVFGMKTLEVARLLADGATQRACDVVVMVSVCGHVWALHVAYWAGSGRMAMHGPVVVGATDTLLGTMKVVAFVVAVKRWAREKALPDWKVRIEAAVGRGRGGEVVGGEQSAM